MLAATVETVVAGLEEAGSGCANEINEIENAAEYSGETEEANTRHQPYQRHANSFNCQLRAENINFSTANIIAF